MINNVFPDVRTHAVFHADAFNPTRMGLVCLLDGEHEFRSRTIDAVRTWRLDQFRAVDAQWFLIFRWTWTSANEGYWLFLEAYSSREVRRWRDWKKLGVNAS